jgi:antitoxin component YwqK of YwqJK toxin-antitoxin module
MHGKWEFFRQDGSIMRSGSFKAGVQSGEWITYDAKGKKVKTTKFSV